MKFNLPTVFVVLILAAIVGYVIYVLIRDKKKGRGSCSCGCSNCAMSEVCHGDDKKR